MAEVAAEAVPNLEPRVVHEAKAEHAAEAEGEAKVVFEAKVELEAKAGQEAKAGLAVGARARAKRKVTHGVKAGSGGHEVAVMKRAMPKTERGRGTPATVAVAAVLTALII